MTEKRDKFINRELFEKPFKPFQEWTNENPVGPQAGYYREEGARRYVTEFELENIGVVEVSLDSICEKREEGLPPKIPMQVVTIDDSSKFIEIKELPPDFYQVRVLVTPKETSGEAKRQVNCQLSIDGLVKYIADDSSPGEDYYFNNWKPEGEDGNNRVVCFQLNLELLGRIEIEFFQPEQ